MEQKNIVKLFQQNCIATHFNLCSIEYIYIYIYYKNEIQNGYDDNTLESALTFLGKIPS